MGLGGLEVETEGAQYKEGYTRTIESKRLEGDEVSNIEKM